jgi:acetyl-CoA C-acetyltransferase
MKEIAIVSAVRTPIGSFGGAFKDISATKLAEIVMREAIKRAGIDPSLIDEVIFGCCMQDCMAPNLARVAALFAGIPKEVTAYTVHQNCASAQRSIISGCQSILVGDGKIYLCGGVESMSGVPYYLFGARFGYRLRNNVVVDGVMQGLTDPYCGLIMGMTAENLAEKYNISRREQDELALLSHQRAVAAIDAGKFKEEIVPVEVKEKKGVKIVDTDEGPRRDTSLEALSKLPPVFKKDGTVTAGNSSSLNDAAACVLLVEKEKAKELGLKPLAYIRSWATVGVDPAYMGIGPAYAVPKALEKGGYKLQDMQLIEINEAFAAQYLAVERELKNNREITNVNGSGISLGHPVGATGTRILVTLIYEMRRRGLNLGIASLCVGGGLGSAIVVEIP